jgi:hypothetical protein
MLEIPQCNTVPTEQNIWEYASLSEKTLNGIIIGSKDNAYKICMKL